jgi:hypothetical protein
MVVAERDLLYDFLEEAGYSEDDVLAYNPVTGKICTRNGGVYEITPTGKIIHYSGPSYDPTERT